MYRVSIVYLTCIYRVCFETNRRISAAKVVLFSDMCKFFRKKVRRNLPQAPPQGGEKKISGLVGLNKKIDMLITCRFFAIRL